MNCHNQQKAKIENYELNLEQPAEGLDTQKNNTSLKTKKKNIRSKGKQQDRAVSSINDKLKKLGW